MFSKAIYSRAIFAIRWLILLTPIGSMVGCNQTDSQLSRKPDGPTSASLRSDEVRESTEPDEFPLLLDRLKQLAGDGSAACGIVGQWQKSDAATDCVLRTHADKKPFYVSYAVQGIDTQGAIGFAGDAAGNVYALEYASEGWPSKGLRKNLQLSDDNHITIEKCSKPVNLRKASDGRVTCFLRDP